MSRDFFVEGVTKGQIWSCSATKNYCLDENPECGQAQTASKNQTDVLANTSLGIIGSQVEDEVHNREIRIQYTQLK